MARRRFIDREVVKVLTEMGYQPVDWTGSQLELRSAHPDTGEVRNVTLPMGDEIHPDTLRSIADQCGADDFPAWCEWIETHL